MTVLRDIACDGCQSLDIVAVSPGAEPDHCGLFVLTHGTPVPSFTPVPEPASWMVLAAAVVLLVVLRWAR